MEREDGLGEVEDPVINGAPDRVPLSRTVTILLMTVTVIVVLDQVTKSLIVERLSEGQLIPIIEGFFNLTLTYNPGAAFGLLADVADGLRQVLLACVTVVALAVVFLFLIKDYYHDQVAQFALGFILGGAAGNIIDRVLLGKVVDFLDFYIGTSHWPAFNVADSAICIGVAILIFRKPARVVGER